MRIYLIPTILLSATVGYGCASTTYSTPQYTTPRADTQNYACGKWSRNSGKNEFFGPDCYWMSSCQYDITRDVRICRVTRPGMNPGLVIYVGKKGFSIASGNYRHHPGAGTTIRIDSNKSVNASDAVDGKFSSSQTSSLVAQMTSGKEVRIAGTEWPSEPINATWQLDGFARAYDFAVQWANSN